MDNEETVVNPDEIDIIILNMILEEFERHDL